MTNCDVYRPFTCILIRDFALGVIVMLYKRNIPVTLLVLAAFIFAWFFCSDPTRPHFGAELRNKSIQTAGKAELDSAFKLFVLAQGDEPLEFKWVKNGSLIAGATFDALVFSALKDLDSGIYRCIVSNDWGKDTSNPCTLSVLLHNRAPVFLDTLPNTFYKIDEGKKLLIRFAASDPDDDTVLIFLDSTTLPHPDSIQWTDSTLAWQSTYSDSGFYYIRLGATDTKDTTTIAINIQVGNAVFAPIITITFPAITRDSCFVHQLSPNIKGKVTACSPVTFSVSINGTNIIIPATPDYTCDVSSANKKEWNTITLTAVDEKNNTTDTTVYLFYKPSLAISDTVFIDSITNRRLRLRWKEIPYCTGYLVYRSDNGAWGTYSLAASINNASTFFDSLLHINTNYWYKVRGFYTASGGFNHADTSGFTDPVSAKTKNWFTASFPCGDNAGAQAVVQTPDSGYIIQANVPSGIKLIKVNLSGDSLWEASHAGSILGYDMKLCTDGNLIIAGRKNGVIFLMSASSVNGSRNWAAEYPSPDITITPNDIAVCVMQTSDNHFLATGYSLYTASAKDSTFFLLKTDLAGTKKWLKYYNAVEGHSVIEKSTKNTYIVAGYTKQADTTYVTLFQIDSGGTMLLAKPYEIMNNNQIVKGDANPFSIIEYASSYYLTGICGVTDLVGGEKGEMFIAKISNAFPYIMESKVFNFKQASRGYSILPIPGNSGFAILGTELYGYPTYEKTALMLKTNAAMDSVSVHKYDNTEKSEIFCGKTTTDGGFVTAGYIDPGPSGKREVYIVKTDEQGRIQY